MPSVGERQSDNRGDTRGFLAQSKYNQLGYNGSTYGEYLWPCRTTAHLYPSTIRINLLSDLKGKIWTCQGFEPQTFGSGSNFSIEIW